MADIRIEATPRESLEVDLVGVRYTIKPPKAALALKLSVRAKQATKGDDASLMIESLYEWLDVAFGKKTAAKVRARLDDGDDDLDMDHINMLMKAVMETATADPTT